MQLYAGLPVGIVNRHADVRPDHADRRAPAQAQAGADAGLEIAEPGECIASVDERRNPPVRLEVILVLDAADDEVLAADDQALRSLRADRLKCVAADRTVATGEETQVWWQIVEVADFHCAECAAHDQPLAVAE